MPKQRPAHPAIDADTDSIPGRADAIAETAGALRAVIVAGEQFHHTTAEYFGVAFSDLLALGELQDGGPISPRALADVVGLTPSTVTALLDRLAAADLAERRPHPTDRRKTEVVITEHGRTVLTDGRRWMLEIVGDLPVGDLARAQTLLTYLAAGIRARTEQIKALQLTDGGASAS